MMYLVVEKGIENRWAGGVGLFIGVGTFFLGRKQTLKVAIVKKKEEESLVPYGKMRNRAN